jgi:hypothetical protein
MGKKTADTEKLIQSPARILAAFDTFLRCFEGAKKTQEDIIVKHPYPSLWAAIEQFRGQVEGYARAEAELVAAGYTSEDAFTYALARGQGVSA